MLSLALRLLAAAGLSTLVVGLMSGAWLDAAATGLIVALVVFGAETYRCYW